jgi:hypothetical protein
VQHIPPLFFSSTGLRLISLAALVITVSLFHISLLHAKSNPSTVNISGQNNWTCLSSHSKHNSEQAGDLTPAIDNHGDVFINEGYVSGGTICFMTNEKIEMDEHGHFFENCISKTTPNAGDDVVFNLTVTSDKTGAVKCESLINRLPGSDNNASENGSGAYVPCPVAGIAAIKFTSQLCAFNFT